MNTSGRIPAAIVIAWLLIREVHLLRKGEQTFAVGILCQRSPANIGLVLNSSLICSFVAQQMANLFTLLGHLPSLATNGIPFVVQQIPNLQLPMTILAHRIA